MAVRLVQTDALSSGDAAARFCRSDRPRHRRNGPGAGCAGLAVRLHRIQLVAEYRSARSAISRWPAAGGPGRHRHARLFRDHGHSARSWPQLRRRGSPRLASGRDRQPIVRQAVLSQPGPDRAAGERRSDSRDAEHADRRRRRRHAPGRNVEGVHTGAVRARTRSFPSRERRSSSGLAAEIRCVWRTR